MFYIYIYIYKMKNLLDIFLQDKPIFNVLRHGLILAS